MNAAAYSRADALREFRPFLSHADTVTLASRFGITRGTLRKWRRSALLSPANIPGRNKWSRDQLLALIHQPAAHHALPPTKTA